MASLENKKIKDTYEGLLKTDDNAAIDGAVEITDGAGNGTGVTISNDGQVTATGTVSFGSLKDTGEDITVTKFVDEADGIGNNDNDTSVPTSAAVKDYVDTNVTAQDLDFQGDTGTGAVDLDSQSLDIAGGTGIDTSAVDQTLTVNIDSTVATLTGTQTLINKSIDLTDNTLSGTTAEFNTALSDDDFATLAGTETLTNKTVDADNNTVSNLEVDNLKSGVLDTDLTSVSASDDTLASAKAIKTYVDSNITAQDLDITDGTTTSAVDLDSQTLTIQGTTNEVEVSLTDQTFTVGLPTSITTNVTGNLTGNVTGDVTGNVTGDVTGNADTASALETARTISLSGDVAGSVSFDGSANADITATIQANSVALGTDTTGDYVSGLGTGTGVTIGSNTGEGSSPTISVDYGSTSNTAVQGNTSLTIQGTANEIEVTGGGVTLGSGGTVTVGLPDDVSLGGSLTIAQNLTVNGTTTTVNTDTLSVEDPLIELARDNSENSVDVGLYGKYSLDSGVTTKYSGLFKDASDSDKFKLFKGLEVEPTSTVDTSGTGYTKGDLVINDLDAVTVGGTLSTAAQPNITSVGTLTSLSVSGTTDLGSTITNGDITIDVDDTPSLHFKKASSADILASINVSTDAGSGGKFVIQTKRNGNTPLDRFTIDDDGNVGIGTSSPSHRLDVTTSDTTWAAAIKNTDSTNGFGLFLQSAESASKAILGAYSGSSYKLYVRGDGNVGIGRSSNINAKLSFVNTVDTNGYDVGTMRFYDDGGSAVYGIGVSANQFNLRAGTSSDGFAFWAGTSQRMRIDSSGRMGLGTSSPASILHLVGQGGSGWTLGARNTLHLQNANASSANVSNAIVLGDQTDADRWFIMNDPNANGTTADVLTITNAGSERMRIDSSGNVGIGLVPNSAVVLDVKEPTGGQDLIFGLTAGTGARAQIRSFAQSDSTTSELGFYTTSANVTTERMRITSGGDIEIPDGNITLNDTGNLNGSRFFGGDSNAGIIYLYRASGSGTSVMRFYVGNSLVGSISTATGTSTAYNTTSDYRLKENVVDMTGALDRVDQLEPKRFNFIADEDITVDGFLAHEVQDIVPEAVTGDKDAVDEDGNDIYQGIDQSKLVPLLVGAIKELNAKVAALEAQINN